MRKTTTGVCCLQGGGEFGRTCRGMDTAVLARSGPGAVVVLPVAAAPGAEYELAGRNGAAYYADLGAPAVRVAPDPRDDAGATVGALQEAGLLVLPGGSPARLLAALAAPLPDAGALGALLARLVAHGVGVCGASAGAMVLASHCLVPDAPDAPDPPDAPDAPGGEVVVARGLGLVTGCVLPHYRHGSSSAADRAARARTAVAHEVALLGLPECAGLLVDGRRAQAVGAGVTTVLHGDRTTRLEPGATFVLDEPAPTDT